VVELRDVEKGFGVDLLEVNGVEVGPVVLFGELGEGDLVEEEVKVGWKVQAAWREGGGGG